MNGFVSRRLLFAACWLGLALQPAAAQDSAASSPPPAAEAGPRPAIWLLEDDDTKIYLFGTIHILPTGFRWRSKTLDGIVAAADELVVETYEPPGGEDEALAEAMLLREPSAILSRVPLEHRKALKAAIRDTGVPIEIYSTMPTWSVGIVLGLSEIFDEYGAEDLTDVPGVEDVLEAVFRTAGKPIHSVEQGEEVLRSLNDLPERLQVEMLVSAIAPVGEEDVRQDGDEPRAADHHLWARGEADAMDIELAEDFPPALFDVLVTRRNRAWTGWLIDRLDKPGEVLFAVGAGHLAGRESLQAMLERRGFTAKRIE